MARTLAQLRADEKRRRAAAIPPAAEPLPPVSSVPSAVYVQEDQPTDVAAGSLWVPLNEDGTAKTIDNWQVFT